MKKAKLNQPLEKNSHAYELILVSQSPRRRNLLEEAGFLFRVDTVEISEIIEENVSLTMAISNLAKAKAQAYLDQHKSLKGEKILLLSADTMVVFLGKAFGKPKTPTEAEEYLQLLSGQSHSVITGLYVANLATGEEFQAASTTEVEFRKISAKEITTYVASGEPMDKAGAYAIQGGGKKFVKSVKGSMTNVIGLPLELFEKTLNEKRWHVARREP